MPNLEPSPPNEPKRPRRRWFQFSLRTMIVATAIFCILLATWIIPSERQRRAGQNLVKQDASYSFEREPRGFLNDDPIYEDGDDIAIWSSSFTGELSDPHPWYKHYFKNIEDIYWDRTPQVEWRSFPHLKRVRFFHQELAQSDASTTENCLLALSKEVRSLESLELHDWNMNQAGVNCLASFSQLEELSLDSVNLHRLKLDPLLSLKSLKVLSILRTNVNYVELKELQKLPHLEVLGVTIGSPVRESLEIIGGFKHLTTIHIHQWEPHLRFSLTGEQFRKLMKENEGLQDGDKLLSILAAVAKQRKIESDALNAANNSGKTP